MRVAMPIFGSRVSPRFDCATRILVVTIIGKDITARQELHTADWTAHDRIVRLISLEVDVVVCGGIDRDSAGQLCDAHITVYSGVTGTSEANLLALLNRELMPLDTPARDAVRNVDRGTPAWPSEGRDGSDRCYETKM